MKEEEQYYVLDKVRALQAWVLLYVSPERLATHRFLEFISDFKIGLLAVDEAHCISQWGHDFSPAYREIIQFRERHPAVPVIALTATATPQVRSEERSV